jgi:hypothetical protein
MISRNLARRLDQLEADSPQPGEPQVMNVDYVGPDGEVVESIKYQLTPVRPRQPGVAGYSRRPRTYR